MCGIGGFCDLTRDNRQWKWEKTGERMCRTLERRGPDDGGLWVGKDCVLAHRRLAVIDPANGQQPMVRTGGTGQVVLVYNGELYNTDPLRRELEKRGHVFSTRTDTEVVLEAWRAYGEQMGEHLEGIYAFAIWDEGRQTLFCCRDRFGVKPFFYAMVGDTFVFGSEPKTL
ncbi:MAG: asparagine synthetase B, partial [Candidatus Onthomonas sp.]|nr:asparagine synthetase B [Candidatus Onthomonas sp.]